MADSLTLTTPREALVTRGFVALSLADLAYFTADGIAIYTLPMAVTGPFGASAAAAGVAFGAFAVTALLARPFAGRLADTRGRLPLMTAGAAIAAVGLALTAYTQSLTVLILLRLLLGVGEAAFFVASLATLADLAPASRLGEAISYNSLGLYLGLTLGPPLGEWLVHTWGFRSAWLGAAAIAALAVVLVRGVGETGQRGTAPGRSRLIHVPAIAPSLGFLTSIVAMGGFLAFAALHAEETGMSSTSLPLVVYGATVVAGRLAFARLIDRPAALPLGATALATMGLGVLLLAVAPTPAGILAGSALAALGVVFSTPAFFSAIFATASPSQRGAAAATASIALDLGLAGGPILVGLVATQQGIPVAFALCAGVTFAGAVWTTLLARRRVAMGT